MITQPIEFFIGDHSMGRSFVAGEDRSRAFFCESCGTIWARAQIPGARWIIESLLCENHQLDWPFRIPGSIWLLWEPAFNASFPPALVEREFRLALAIYDRFKEMYA